MVNQAAQQAGPELDQDQARRATLARIAAQRERMRGRPIIRFLAAGAGILMGLASLPLLIVLPELGIPLLLGGLGLLALRFDWASRAVVKAEWWTLLFRRWLARQSRAVRIALLVAVIAVAALIIWLIL
ncbi:hypothetical protein J4573_50765 [Actinomadura barringtoniae]|uniref:TIGR02611 family protein n=1 Tax=Actinomadura barringtoniae TaxID=1427535 RepID=A0A939TGH9_9ACTN|nr:hypothetical protein [Actinomadura barringtoniae]MBO2455440.1 hypothetical protein [Actinomadura barringtoniae]